MKRLKMILFILFCAAFGFTVNGCKKDSEKEDPTWDTDPKKTDDSKKDNSRGTDWEPPEDTGSSGNDTGNEEITDTASDDWEYKRDTDDEVNSTGPKYESTKLADPFKNRNCGTAILNPLVCNNYTCQLNGEYQTRRIMCREGELSPNTCQGWYDCTVVQGFPCFDDICPPGKTTLQAVAGEDFRLPGMISDLEKCIDEVEKCSDQIDYTDTGNDPSN